MAKSGKVVQLFQKPDNFIKSRARELKLGRCFINEDWEEAGIASAIVSRVHNNGNLTFGFYLLDLKCLGVKDAFYRFNEPEDELDYFVEQINGIEIDYAIIHNIIYGAEAFANDCGFNAHKSWAVARYILEEDDDRIPLIDIEFGHDGMPAYYVGPYDDELKINQILDTLKKNVGEGNFLFYRDEEDFDDEPAEIFGEDFNVVDLKERFFDLIAQYDFAKNKQTLLSEDHLLKIVNDRLISLHYHVDEDVENHILDSLDDYEDIFDEKSDDSILQINKLIEENPDNPYLYVELFLQYKMARRDKDAKALAKQGIERFPDFLYLRFFVAHTAFIDQETQKGFSLLKEKHYLEEAFPYRKQFSEGEFMLFYTASCEYFLLEDDIANAVVCASLLINDMYAYTYNELAVSRVCEAIERKLGF